MKQRAAGLFSAFGATLILVILAYAWADRPPVHPATPVPPLGPTERHRLALMRAAGISGDQSQIPNMVAALDRDHPTYVATALRSLSEVGGKESLSAIEKVIIRHPKDYIGARARMIHARLIAEGNSSKLIDPQLRAASKISVFLSEARLSHSELVSQSVKSAKSGNAYQSRSADVYAVEEISDIMYRDTSANYQTIADLQGVDFSADPASAIKVQLSQLPKAKRTDWLINELAHKRVLRGEDGFLLQLAVDEGVPASRLAVKKLMEMDTNRSEYTYIGFLALFEVLRGIGDTNQTSVVEHFLHDKDRWIAYYAQQVYPDVKQGSRCQYAAGY